MVTVTSSSRCGNRTRCSPKAWARATPSGSSPRKAADHQHPVLAIAELGVLDDPIFDAAAQHIPANERRLAFGNGRRRPAAGEIARSRRTSARRCGRLRGACTWGAVTERGANSALRVARRAKANPAQSPVQASCQPTKYSGAHTPQTRPTFHWCSPVSIQARDSGPANIAHASRKSKNNLRPHRF